VALLQVIAEAGAAKAKSPKSVTTLNIKPTDNFIVLFAFFINLFLSQELAFVKRTRLIIVNFLTF
jgi:hypothetical protein